MFGLTKLRHMALRKRTDTSEGEVTLLQQSVGKISRFRRVKRTRWCVITDVAVYFYDETATRPTEAVEWKDVIVAELVRSSTGACGVELIFGATFGMRLLLAEWHDEHGSPTSWSKWISVLNFLSQKDGSRMRFTFCDEQCGQPDSTWSVRQEVAALRADLHAASADLRNTIDWVTRAKGVEFNSCPPPALSRATSSTDCARSEFNGCCRVSASEWTERKEARDKLSSLPSNVTVSTSCAAPSNGSEEDTSSESEAHP
jgi:hypothetical protein